MQNESIGERESAINPEDAYDELLDRVKQMSYLGEAAGLLSWDQQVVMPEDGSAARAKQYSALSSLLHDYITDERTGELLDALEDAELSAEELAVVRETRRNYEQEVRVPGELVEELARIKSEAQQAWEEAKAEDNFDDFAATLGTVRDLWVQRAESIDSTRDPYQVMFEGIEPDISLARVNDIFDELRNALIPLLEELEKQDARLTDPFADYTVGHESQEELSRRILDDLGFDWERGRLDTSSHPFTVGSQYDCRVTTRFDEDDPLGSIFATIHEFGHATYQLGLPKEHYGTPLGQSHHILHESQSRFWENHVARTKAFWEHYAPVFNTHLGTSFSPQELFEAANRIKPNNPIRVDADELTYHLHIILRTEIEKRFVSGQLEAEEIPAVWNSKMEEYLGVRPSTDSEGCLQDIHWTSGFADFQSYTIGSLLAAQFDAALRRDLDEDVDDLIRAGEFKPLRNWMTEHIHQHGQRFTADEVVERATGESLTADYFIDYVSEKFGRLYEC